MDFKEGERKLEESKDPKWMDVKIETLEHLKL